MTYKTPTILFLLLISSDLSIAKGDTLKVGIKTFIIEPSTKADFDKIPSISIDTSEANNLTRDSQNVRRKGDTLFFKLNTGKIATLANKISDDEGYAIYYYVNKLQRINQYYVKGHGYEYPIYALISCENGDTTWIAGNPIISPDKQFLICGDNDVLGLVGIALFEINNSNKLIFIGSTDTQKLGWGVTEIKWIDNAHLIVKKDAPIINGSSSEYIGMTMIK